MHYKVLLILFNISSVSILQRNFPQSTDIIRPLPRDSSITHKSRKFTLKTLEVIRLTEFSVYGGSLATRYEKIHENFL